MSYPSLHPRFCPHSSSTYTADALCPVSTPKFCPIFHPPTELMLRFLSLHPQVLSHSSSTYRVDALFPISNPQVLSHSSSTYRVDALCPISVPPGSVPLFIPLTELMVCVFCPVPNGVVRGDGDSTTATARFPAHHLGGPTAPPHLGCSRWGRWWAGTSLPVALKTRWTQGLVIPHPIM